LPKSPCEVFSPFSSRVLFHHLMSHWMSREHARAGAGYNHFQSAFSPF
jgi:hypothetical protein